MNNNLVTTTAQDVLTTFARVSSDVLVLGAVFLLLLALFLSVGKGRAVVGIVAVYIASVLYQLFPYQETVQVIAGDVLGTYVPLVLFVVLLSITSFLLWNTSALHFSFGTMKRWASAGVLSLMATMLLATVVMHLGIMSNVYTFSEPLQHIMGTPENVFWWVMLPLVVILLLTEHRE